MKLKKKLKCTSRRIVCIRYGGHLPTRREAAVALTRLWKHLGTSLDTTPQAATRLGEREREVLEVLWNAGSATVHQVAPVA